MLKTKPQEYNTDIGLVAAIDDFISKKNKLSQDDKWSLFNSIAKQYEFPIYNGDIPEKNQLIELINIQIRKRGLSLRET